MHAGQIRRDPAADIIVAVRTRLEDGGGDDHAGLELRTKEEFGRTRKKTEERCWTAEGDG